MSIGLRICSRMSSRATSGARVRPPRRPSCKSAGIFLEGVGDPQARQRDLHVERGEDLAHPRDELLELGVVAGRERQQADLVVPRVLVALQGGVDDRLDGPVPERALDHGALAEPALPGAAAHDLDGDPVVRRFHERDDRRGRQGDLVEPLDHARFDRGGDVGRGSGGSRRSRRPRRRSCRRTGGRRPSRPSRRSARACRRASRSESCFISAQRSQTTGRLGSPSPMTNRSMNGASSSGFWAPGRRRSPGCRPAPGPRP